MEKNIIITKKAAIRREKGAVSLKKTMGQKKNVSFG